jgi:hypothetical protein
MNSADDTAGNAADNAPDDTARIAGEFPDWEAWQGIDRMWHARIRGSFPPVMVHGEDLVDLRDQIIRFMGRSDLGPP